MLWFFASACVPEAGPLGLVAELQDPPDAAVVAAARELQVSTTDPATLRVTLDDGERTRTLEFPEPATAREVPLLGFTPGARSTVTITATDQGGAQESKAWEVEIPALPAQFPFVEVLALEAAAVEPGWTLLDIKVPNSEAQYLVILDESLRVVWWWVAEAEFGDARLLANGHLLVLGGGQAWELDLLGRVIQRWGSTGAEGEGPLTALGTVDLNHEIIPLADGFLSLSSGSVRVDAFPVDYTTPEAFAPATIADEHIVKFGWDGSPELDLALSDLLDTRRIGFDSLDEVKGGFDWVHANAVIPDPTTGGLLVSLRHQDALAGLTAEGELSWILGTPSGWQAPWVDKLLSPVGSPFSWPYHPHAPELEADGTIVCFDNGFHGYTPYDEPVEEPPARAVGYRVDLDARTVEQTFSFSETATGPLSSTALGDADLQPETGNILADFGFVSGEGGLTNEELGYGRRSVRLVEWSPNGEVVADVRLRSDVAAEPEGWKAYRAERLWPWPAAGAAHAALPAAE